MALRIEVSNFGLVEAAVVDVDRVTVLGGHNDQGKSTILNAARLAVSGTLPAGMTKKDATALVRDGMEVGSVKVTGPDGSAAMILPKAEPRTNGLPPRAGASALGIADYLAMDDKQRARVLTELLKTSPDRNDLAQALPEHAPEEVDAIWKNIVESGGNVGGWDAVHKATQTEGTGLKRDWCTATGSKAWGSQAGASFEPDGWSLDLADPEITKKGLIEDVEAAKEELTALDVAGAVSEQRLAELKTWGPDALEKLQGGLAGLEAEEAKTKAAVDKIKAEIAALPKVSSQDELTSPCPHCGEAIAVQPNPTPDGRYNLQKPASALSAQEIKKARADHAALVKRQEMASRPWAAATKAATAHRAAITTAEGMNAKYEEALAAQQSAEDNADARAQAADKVVRMQKRITAWVSKTGADRIHREIMRNLAVQAALADDGVRRTKLIRVLDQFNDAVLAPLVKAAGWKPVRIEPDLEPSYGGRRISHFLCRSSVWRVQAALRAAFAKTSKAELVLIDDADVVVKKADQAGLIRLLSAAGVPALVCIAAPLLDRVSDFTKIPGVNVLWVEQGRVIPIADALAAQQKAADAAKKAA